MFEPQPLTDEERQLTEGMPPAVAAGFVSARRADRHRRGLDNSGGFAGLGDLFGSIFNAPGFGK
ncbi:hypothetical protein [Mycobacterium sp. 1245801.1]|uniref:hypothetical protein n=1 Tax=Mycobacterium sp. 1245801.1 TaxID=1834075 RepID=UPI0007FBE646|nr:hypothetical protein [Mycobacterium sp. 1245801.1]OBJ24620.1 hypothetical protein A5622_11630 [Mycobacterium sp. 1245801.1]